MTSHFLAFQVYDWQPLVHKVIERHTEVLVSQVLCCRVEDADRHRILHGHPLQQRHLLHLHQQQHAIMLLACATIRMS